MVKFYVPDELLGVDVGDLGMGVRATNALYRNGIRTVGQLIDENGNTRDLSKLRNMGKISINEIGRTLFNTVFENMGDQEQVNYLRNVYALNCSDDEHLVDFLKLLKNFLPDDNSIDSYIERLGKKYA